MIYDLLLEKFSLMFSISKFSPFPLPILSIFIFKDHRLFSNFQFSLATDFAKS